MKCLVGVHTGRIALEFTEHDWANVRMAVPGRVGHRSWHLMERDGGISAARSIRGVAPHRIATHKGYVILSTDADTIVRCHTHEREVTFPRAGQIFVPMPPHHEWPWMKDMTANLRRMTPEQWRWHLVQEVNARLRSAKAAGAWQHRVGDASEYMDLGLPPWASRMLTVHDGYLLHVRGEEIY